jgi:hypothetical protein
MKKLFPFMGLILFWITAPAQNVGINIATPSSRLHVQGTAWFQGDNTPLPATAGKGLAIGMGGEVGYIFSFDYASFTPRDLALQGPGGNVGIGTANPLPGYRLDINGPTRVYGDAAHFLANATGGTNSWARLYMRSTAQSWFIGTSQNFNGNQLYLVDETSNQTRLAIQPAGGPIFVQGNTTQNVTGYGFPKAMIYLNSNGTIGRCYNGVNGASSGGCGFTASRLNAGNYQVNFPFDITTRFFAVTGELPCCPGSLTVSYAVFGNTTLNIGVLYKVPNVINPEATDRPVMIIVY